MSFLIQRVVGRGLSLNEVRGNTLRIGRGTQQQLRSDNPAVALEHAVIEGDQGGYTVTDRGSITGTYVNGRAVESQRLAKGDVLEAGDLRIDVQSAEAGKPLFLRVASTSPRSAGRDAQWEEAEGIAAGPAGGTLHAPRVDYARSFRLRRPWFTRTSIAALLLILTLAVIGEVTQPGEQKAFMPGGVSSAHARARDARGQLIGNDCAACHDAWNGVSNARCSDCHGKAGHAANVAKEPDCGTCHMEHRGSAKLALIADARCVRCHADLRPHMRVAEARALTSFPSVKSFATGHPEFTWPADTDTLRLNHKLHLRKGGVFNARGKREELTCASCHKLVETRGKIDPAPISFEAHCHRCHQLTFDARFPDTEVPHGADPGLLYGFILSTYGGNRDIAGKPPDEVRRILTSRPEPTLNDSAVINAEQVIKTKCTLCHEIRRSEGRLAATRPIIRTVWLEHARFSHGPHRTVDCTKCHDAQASVSTSDVLMPKRSDCTDCHASRSLTAAGTSNCILCHDYHGQPNQMTTVTAAAAPKRTVAAAAMIGDDGTMLTTVLLLAIFVLLLVVLVPVGYALYQRLKPAPAAPAPQPRAAAPAPPPMRAPDVPPIAAEPPAPPRPAAPAPAPTEMIRIDDLKKPAADGPQATEMVRWYGMLHCTAGPLEGQRFIVDDAGFYIGRDASMAQVIVNDSRVSKRHLRIVPRNGKVWAVDQGSTNGTFLGSPGGERITEVELKRGDTLILAESVATFVYEI